MQWKNRGNPRTCILWQYYGKKPIACPKAVERRRKKVAGKAENVVYFVPRGIFLPRVAPIGLLVKLLETMKTYNTYAFGNERHLFRR